MTKRFFSETPYQKSSPGLPESFNQILSQFKKDDLLLIGIILILLGDGCDDKELLIILGLLFISDKINFINKLYAD